MQMHEIQQIAQEEAEVLLRKLRHKGANYSDITLFADCIRAAIKRGNR